MDESTGVSTLLLHFPSRLESGRVVCTAENGVGGVGGGAAGGATVEMTSSLVVHHGPDIFKSASYGKIAVPRGSPAYIPCRVMSVPASDFTWRMDSAELNKSKVVDPNDPSHGETILLPRRVPGYPNTVDSVLKLDNVRTEHYGTTFHCRANNSYGWDSHVVALVPPGRPDPPAELHVVATAADSVTLGWRPGTVTAYDDDTAGLPNGFKKRVWRFLLYVVLHVSVLHSPLLRRLRRRPQPDIRGDGPLPEDQRPSPGVRAGHRRHGLVDQPDHRHGVGATHQLHHQDPGQEQGRTVRDVRGGLRQDQM